MNQPIPKIPTGHRWLIVSSVILIGSALVFWSFVNDRSKSLSESETQSASRTEMDANAKNRLADEFSNGSKVLSDEEYLAATREAEARIMERYNHNKRAGKERRLPGINAAREDWNRKVARLKLDLKQIGPDQPGMSEGLEKKLKRLMKDRPQ